MTKQDLGNLVFKSFAMYAFLMALNNASFMVNDMLEMIEGGYSSRGKERALMYILAIILPALSMVFAGIVLWFSSERITRYLFASEKPIDISKVSTHDIQVIAFSIGGLFVLSNAIGALIQNGTVAVMLLLAGEKVVGIVRQVLEYVIRILIGLWLLFGARGIVIFIRKILDTTEVNQ